MKITESKLRKIIRSVITESAISARAGCEVFGESIDFNSFVLRIVLKNEKFVKYAKEAIKMQEGEIESESGTTLIAKFSNETRAGKDQSPGLVSRNITFWVYRCS